MTPEKLQSKEPEPNLNTIAEILYEAKQACDQIPTESGVVKQGVAFGDHLADTETAADQIMGNYAIQKIKSFFPNIPARILVEGKDEVRIGEEEPVYSWYVDPLDGSLNREKKGNTIGLPYSFAISVFEGVEHRYDDYQSAGVIDLRFGDSWVAQKGKGAFVNGELCRTSGNTSVNLGSNIGIAEQYYPFNRYLFSEMFSEQKGWLRSPGSAAVEMAKITHGETDFYITAFQKSDISGATFALLNEAGGFACVMNGNPLGPREYEFTKPIEQGVIYAASRPLAEELVERTHKALIELKNKNVILEYPKL